MRFLNWPGPKLKQARVGIGKPFRSTTIKEACRQLTPKSESAASTPFRQNEAGFISCDVSSTRLLRNSQDESRMMENLLNWGEQL